jgi:WD40 repeat protein
MRLSDEFHGFKIQITIPDFMTGVVFSPDGQSVVLVGGGDSIALDMYAFPSLKRRFRLSFGSSRPVTASPDGTWRPSCERVVFSPDSQWLLWPTAQGELVEVNAETGTTNRTWNAHDGFIHTIDYAPSTSLVATGGSDGILKLWEADYQAIAVRTRRRDITEAFLERARPFTTSEEWWDTTEVERISY